MTQIYKIENFKFQYPNSKLSISIEGTLDINSGDIILLQGNSGSGKSTLLLALSGIIPKLINGKLSGNILFHNKNLLEFDNTNHIGYLGQNPHNQLVCETVYQELAFGLENQVLEPLAIRQKIEQYSSKFKITHLLHREARTLSGGEKQKINLLAILIMEPEVLLLDEPTAFLDPQSAMEIIAILKEYSKQKTIIIIEHNIHYLKHLVNRVIIINHQGQITEHNPLDINFSPKLVMQACKLTQEEIPAYVGMTGHRLPRYHTRVDARNDMGARITDTAAALLQINNLNFNYNKQQPLLNDINLSIYPGQIIGIIGKNGSGKSSLLKLISKIIPCQNSIYYKQHDICKIKTANYWHEISLLWQNPENHFLYHSVNHELNNDLTVMRQFALDELAAQNPYCLSEGQKRRLSLAISVKPDIELFLMDEPTFGQDLENKQVLANLISDLACAKKSFIIVSHDIPFLNALTNNIYQLENGVLIREKL
jgi:energy-coupling factor transporter ATP-binding protein EcfA2